MILLITLNIQAIPSLNDPRLQQFTGLPLSMLSAATTAFIWTFFPLASDYWAIFPLVTSLIRSLHIWGVLHSTSHWVTLKHHTDFGTLNQSPHGKTVSTDVEASSWHITERKTGSWWNRGIHRISNFENNTWVSTFTYRVALEGTNVEGRAFDFLLDKTLSWFYF